MRALAVVVLLCVAVAATGCSNSRGYFAIEEFGEGWQLKVEEKDKSFRASWVEGKNRTAKLVNYHDAPNGEYIVVNTLYLELDKDGRVVNGRLKRFTTPEFSKRAFHERHANWWRVLRGSCVLDAKGNGQVDVTCEGKYEFKGSVEADEYTKFIKPE
jgi:hypothetical protein